MSEPDIRWQQRLANYIQALTQLGNAVTTHNQRPLPELEKQGLIQAFEFTHELAWNVMKDYFAYQGTPDITGSRDAVREAFQKAILSRFTPTTLILSGTGEFLLQSLFAKVRYPLCSLAHKLGKPISGCSPAHAVAVLATENPA